MIISQPTKTTCPRQRLPDSAQFSRMHALSKRIRSIRLIFNRSPLLISNSYGLYEKTMSRVPLREEFGGLGNRWTAEARRAWTPARIVFSSLVPIIHV
jgi:hypothetical protein